MTGAVTRPLNQPVTPVFLDDGWFYKGMWYPRLLPTGVYPAVYIGYSQVGIDTWDFGFRVQYRSEITPRCFSFGANDCSEEEAKTLHNQFNGVKGLKINLCISDDWFENRIMDIIFPNGTRIFRQSDVRASKTEL